MNPSAYLPPSGKVRAPVPLKKLCCTNTPQRITPSWSKANIESIPLRESSPKVRPAGTYKAGVASEEPHTEGGRDEDVVILFSLRPYDAETPIYEILDDNRDVAATMNFNGLKELHESKAA